MGEVPDLSGANQPNKLNKLSMSIHSLKQVFFEIQEFTKIGINWMVLNIPGINHIPSLKLT